MNGADLRTVLQIIDGLINGAVPAKSEHELTELRLRISQQYAARGPERGEKVFEWRLPIIREHILSRGKNKGKVRKKKCVPTMNDMVNMNVWEKQEVREWQEKNLLDALISWPLAVIQDTPRPRAVRVTRRSKMPPDELSCDAIGGKGLIDRMVDAGILAGDGPKHLYREALWFAGDNAGGEVLVEVFELAGAAGG
jgi:hypothetical protein